MSAHPGTTSWLNDAAAAAPDKPALYEPGRDPVTYSELERRAATVAEELAGGQGPVPIELAPGIDHATAFHAAMLAGRPAFTVRPELPEPLRRAVLEVAEVPLAAGEVVARVLSSGTSGVRKPVDLTRHNFEASAAGSAAALGTDDADVWLACLPMDHVGGLSILTRAAIHGTAALIHPRFDVEAVADALAGTEVGVSAVSLVPTQLSRLLDAGADFSRLRFALVGGASLSPTLLDRALDAGVPIALTYGLTEACSQVTTLPPEEVPAKRGSSGRALAGVTLRIGEGGRIEIKGPAVAPAAADEDGWLRTGDIGTIDAEDYLWVEGRADDLIVTGGENVRPEPVEERLCEHPAIVDAAVVGMPDPEWGQAVVAFVELAGDAPAEDLIEHCREALAPASVPKRVEIVEALPRTASGKLQRARIRAAAQGL
jgi:O-succinylbenzoic acid--CoA ligase